jgi:predicted phosphodiesterase
MLLKPHDVQSMVFLCSGPEHAGQVVAIFKMTNEINLFFSHICGVPPIANQAAAGLIAIEQPNVVVFGHSHVPGVYLHEGIIYINREQLFLALR